ncbi:MAG: hypothetical protein KKA73_16640 [Chloroflexi bacterium]|nr:hypothetical protein [Chloroflexota bacterium]MBU1749314.1 hypothetical protein [Chloroflexota bacterium]
MDHMTVSGDFVAQDYIHLALAIEQHIPGYIDAYYGPPAWRQQAQEAAPQPVANLLKQATDLADAVAADAGMDPQRRDHLAKEVRAMQTALRILDGEELTFVEEVEGLYDITPEWMDEAVFEEAHRTLEDLLPPGDSIQERMIAHRKTTEIAAERAVPLLHEIVTELRRRTQARFPLPAGESFEIQLVKDQPWAAYNWYLGGLYSRVDVNTDLPMHVTDLVYLMAHEGYPGHHTELSIKDARLVQELGYLEFSIAILYAPASFLSEGIATRAQEMILSDDEWVSWHANEILARAGLEHIDAAREHALIEASKHLEAVGGNVAFLLRDRGVSEEEAVAYTQRYALSSEEEARHFMGFLSDRFSCSYIFNYYFGGKMLDALFAARGDREHWFTRLLAEPVTPSQLQVWTAQT